MNIINDVYKVDIFHKEGEIVLYVRAASIPYAFDKANNYLESKGISGHISGIQKNHIEILE
jgi:hypothetical protein